MYSYPAIAHSPMGCIRGIAVAAALLGPLAAAAQPADAPDLSRPAQSAAHDPASRHGLGLRLGYHSGYRKATLAYETPGIWDRSFSNGWGRAELNVELGAAYWKAWRAGPKSMAQLSAIPTLRWWPDESFYLEAGFGPTLLSRSEFAGRDLGTRFQFGSHLGAGLLIQQAHRIGIRYSHYSNAGIKKPNPGLNLFEAAYTYYF